LTILSSHGYDFMINESYQFYKKSRSFELAAL